MSPMTVRLTITVVDNMQKFEVRQWTTQGVGVRRAETTNDEVGRTAAAREALTTHVEFIRAADRLRVEHGRQR